MGTHQLLITTKKYPYTNTYEEAVKLIAIAGKSGAFTTEVTVIGWGRMSALRDHDWRLIWRIFNYFKAAFSQMQCGEVSFSSSLTSQGLRFTFGEKFKPVEVFARIARELSLPSKHVRPTMPLSVFK